MTAISDWRYQTASYSEHRLRELAKPKGLHPAFLSDRRSVYWVDRLPPTGPTKFGMIVLKPRYRVVYDALTARQEELVKCKQYHPAFIPDKPTPKWEVSPKALHAYPTKRLRELAKPKPFHHSWIPMKSAYTVTPKSALEATASARLDQLAQPKTYAPLLIKSDSEWDWGEWISLIPKAAKDHVASARLEQLAEPRSCSEGYLDNRSVAWNVPKTAMQTQATTRLQQLARPKTRQALDQDYDPYKVSYAAKMATPSPRVEDLAVPIPRKVRAKKAA